MLRDNGVRAKIRDLYQFGDQELEDVADDVVRSLNQVEDIVAKNDAAAG